MIPFLIHICQGHPLKPIRLKSMDSVMETILYLSVIPPIHFRAGQIFLTVI